MNRRETIKLLVIGTAAGPMIFNLEGCTQSEFQKLVAWVPVGIAAFDGAVAIANPAAGSALAVAEVAVDALWKVLQADIVAYQNAPAANKTTAMGQIETAIGVVVGNITNIIPLIPGAQEYTVAITASLNLIIATLESIGAQLNPSTTATAKAAKKTAVAKAPKDVKDFKKQYNAIMVTGKHPEKQLH